MFFGTNAKLPKLEDIDVQLQHKNIKPVAVHKYLGITLDSKLIFSQHVDAVRRKTIPKIKTLGHSS